MHPNPLVGATVLAGNTLAGEGWHAEHGDRHAEPIALDQAGDRSHGGTLVVTLEPCAHEGKQPPCTDAIIRAGIRRVVAAVGDPNPVASGGAEQLRAAGVEVELGLLARQAGAQNAAFLHRFQEPSRPFVALKLATSLDGRIADAAGRSRWISGREAQEHVHWLRAGYDAVAVGGRTARADDPQLTVRGSVEPRNPPRRVVFDAGADLDPDLTLVRTARRTPTLLVTSPAAPEERVDKLAACGVTILPAATLAEGLQVLRRAGIDSLLVEGGGRLAGALLGQELADRYYWFQSPLWLGERGIPAIAGLPSEPLDRAERWHPVERRSLGEDTLLVVDRD